MRNGWRVVAAAALAVAGASGCATRADLVQRDQQLLRFVREQRRQLEAMQREIERLRGDVEGTGVAGSRDTGGLEVRVAALEARVYEGVTPSVIGPDGTEIGVQVNAMGDPTLAPEPVPTGVASRWATDIERERAEATASGDPARDEYLGILEMLEHKDCGPAVSRLDAFAQQHRTSDLADNALYWAARCYVLMGDSTPGRSTEFYNQAISKFYDVGTSYPKGDKTPPALWEQGNLFIQLGDVPDARIVFSRLIRDYPASPEAAQARQKLAELD
jgi:TolA-binding protein